MEAFKPMKMKTLKTSFIIIFASICFSSSWLLADTPLAEASEPAQSSVVTFVWPGDFHLTTPTHPTTLALQQVIAETNTVIRPDFIHLAGDNTDNGTEEEYLLLKNILSSAHATVYPMIGDHDVKRGVQNWQTYFGKAHDSFDFGGYHFVTLNSMDGNTNTRKAGFSDEQLQWLDSDLEDAESRHLPSVLFWHFYPPDKLGASWQKIRQLITKHKVLGVLTGHAHFNQITNYGDVAVITTRTILSPKDGGNTGYAVVCLDQGILSWKFKELNQDFPFAMITYPTNNILATEASAVVKGHSLVRVKAFSDQTITQSRYRIGDGEWMSMSALLDEGMWEATFDSRNLPDGEHKLSVEVTDSKNRKTSDEITLIVNQQGEFTRTAKRSIPDIIPGVGMKPDDGRKPIILTGQNNELLLSVSAVWIMTPNGLEEREIRTLSTTPHAIYAASKEGLFRSREGRLFTEVKRTIDDKEESFGEVTAFVTDERGIIYVSTHHDGVFKSHDEGASWEEISRPLAAQSDDFHVHALVVDAQNRLYAGTASGIFRTDDGGASWDHAGLEGLYVKTMTRNRHDSRLYAATKHHHGLGSGAVYRLSSGTTWEKLGNDNLQKQDIEAIFVSRNKIYALTKHGLYVSAGRDFSLEEDLSRNMGFSQETKVETKTNLNHNTSD